MICFLELFVILILCSLRIDSNNNYLSKEKTTVIKGIFIILVFLSHFNSYTTYVDKYDIAYLNVINYIGQAMVVPFLFYSGYGIMEQINKKGRIYIKKIPIKRILVTLIKFDIAVLLFYVITILFNNQVSLSKLLLSFIGWESLGNSNWYIFTILMLYLFTYISFVLIKNKRIALIVNTIIVCLYVLILYYFNIKPLYWYDTALCYILGMYYSVFKDKIYGYINFSNIRYVISLIFLILLCFVFKEYSSYTSINILFNMLFGILIVMFTMRISIRSKILSWCGSHLFEIYILQRIPMIVFLQLGLFSNIYLCFMGCVIVTIVIVLVYKKVVDKIILKLV